MTSPAEKWNPSANQPDQWATQSGSAPTREEIARDRSQEEVIIPLEFVNNQMNKVLK